MATSSGLTALAVSGDYVYFGAVAAVLPLRTMLVAAPVAGLVGGALGGGFSRALIALAWSRDQRIVWLRARPIWLAAVCGVVVAWVGYTSAGLTWGTGYDVTRGMLEGHSAPLLVGPARLLATTATALSGVPGGIFAPSLSVGAGMGQFLALLFPGQPSGALVLLGMAGYFTGVVRAPLTSVIIMTEMTAGRTMILPLFATAMIADWTSARVCRSKLYHALSRKFSA